VKMRSGRNVVGFGIINLGLFGRLEKGKLLIVEFDRKLW